MAKSKYFKEMIKIGLPITLQCIFQASYSLVDQLMVGRLGAVSIAASGLGTKFSSIVMFTMSAIAAVSSILIAQYHGTQDEKGKSKSFFSCLYIGLVVLLFFMLPSILVPDSIMGIYSTDKETVLLAGRYLRIIGISFCPMTLIMLCASYLRSTEHSKLPMYASVICMFINLFFDYSLIYGKFGMPALGLIGAGYGTLIGRCAEAIILIVFMLYLQTKGIIHLTPLKTLDRAFYKKISVIIFPILINEFSWSIGENIYAVVYGRMGTTALAATTLLNPLMGMFIGMFSGISTAASVMVGKRLGSGENDEAYSISGYLIKVGLIGSLIVSGILIAIAGFYISLYDIEPEVAIQAKYLIYALTLIIFAKITNMIIAGGILRSGGNTQYTLIIDLIGTWIFGVPLAFISAYIFKLPVYQVYFILSLEEVVRLILGVRVYKSRKWIRKLTE